MEIDYSRKWQAMVAVAMGIFLATIDGSIVNVALPTLVRALDTEFAIVQWVVLAYLLALTTLMLSVGRLADMMGKKPLYTAGFVVFTVGSVLCGLSPTIYWLIAFRVVQAVGAAMILALGQAIVTEAFPPSERGRALGIAGGLISVGIVIGPTLGGIIIESLSWHWIFFVNLPVGILGTVLAARFVPATRPAGRQRFDLLGALTLFIALISLLLALTLGQNAGFAAPLVLALFGAALVFTAFFVLVELRVEQPMIALRLFQNRMLTVNLLTGLVTFISVGGALILMPFYLEGVLGYDPRQTGLLLSAVPIALGVLAPVSGTLSDRFGTRPISLVGLAVLFLGYLGLSTLGTETSAVGFLLLFLPIGIGMGIFQSPNNSAIMGAAGRGQLGVVSGLLSVTRTLGQTSGIAVLGALWAARVFAHAGQTLPGGATTAAPAHQAAGLHDTFLLISLLLLAATLLSVWQLGQESRRARESEYQTTDVLVP